MKLRYVTFTGADNKTDLKSLQNISNDFPFVEWGFLLSKSKTGTARYPSVDKFIDIQELNINKSIHVCGEFCRLIVKEGGIGSDDNYKLFSEAMMDANRCQLNFNIKNTDVDLANLFSFINRVGAHFILQQNKSNDSFIQGIAPHIHYSNRIEILFDASGGRGSEIQEIPQLIPNLFCGYAGGLNPDNLEQKLKDIEAVVGDNEIWIDFESGVRTNDEFDLLKVVKCCEIAKKYIV
jgi:hypothetical protein